MKNIHLVVALGALAVCSLQVLADGVVAARVELNYQPSATPDLVEVIEGDSVEIVLRALDPESESLTFSIVAPPSFGNLLDFSPSAGTLRYASLPGISGTDSFTFVASDGITPSDPATISVRITSFADFIFADGFESGDLSKWDSSTSP